MTSKTGSRKTKTTKKTKTNKLKTYIWVSREYNSHSQEGNIIVTFKAESLNQLDTYISLYQNGLEEQIPKGRFKIKHQIPARFYEAGGFCSDDLSFICRDNGEDMSKWFNTSGFGFIKG